MRDTEALILSFGTSRVVPDFLLDERAVDEQARVAAGNARKHRCVLQLGLSGMCTHDRPPRSLLSLG